MARARAIAIAQGKALVGNEVLEGFMVFGIKG